MLEVQECKHTSINISGWCLSLGSVEKGFVLGRVQKRKTLSFAVSVFSWLSPAMSGEYHLDAHLPYAKVENRFYSVTWNELRNGLCGAKRKLVQRPQSACAESPSLHHPTETCESLGWWRHPALLFFRGQARKLIYQQGNTLVASLPGGQDFGCQLFTELSGKINWFSHEGPGAHRNMLNPCPG